MIVLPMSSTNLTIGCMKTKLSERLQDYKTKQNYSLMQFAEALKLSHGTLGAWIRGDYPPDHASLEMLADYLKVDVWTLANEAWAWPLPPSDLGKLPEAFQALFAHIIEIGVQSPHFRDFLTEQLALYTKYGVLSSAPAPVMTKPVNKGKVRQRS